MGDRLRKARELTKLDQTDFAAELGITRQSVSNYESGRRTPRPLYLHAWSEATGVSIEWLETGMAHADEARADESRLSDLNRRPVLYEVAGCSCEYDHGRGDCPTGCGCGWCAPELYDSCPDFVPSWMVEAVSAR